MAGCERRRLRRLGLIGAIACAFARAGRAARVKVANRAAPMAAEIFTDIILESGKL